MSINLLQTLKSKVGGKLAEHSAAFFEEEQKNTDSAVDGTFAAILAGMIQRVSTDKGAKDLHSILKNEKVREYELENIFTRSPQTVNGLVNRGTHFLPSLFPTKLREATNAVAEASKVTKRTSSKMAKISAPLMLSTLGQHIQDNKLSVDGLKSLLNGQKTAVQSALPTSFIEASELSTFGWVKKIVVKEEPKPKKVKEVKADTGNAEVAKDVKPNAGNTNKGKKVAAAAAPIAKAAAKVEGAAAGGMGFLKWLLPFLAGLGLTWFLLTKGCAGAELPKVADVVPSTTAITEVVKETAAVATSAFGKVNDAAMGLLDNIKFGAGSAGEQMMAFIKNDAGSEEGRFRFKNLNFASGKATISGESGSEVDNLASILKAYEDIKVKVEGYTDSRGKADSNKALSQRRAEAVRTRLIAAGISDERISTEGFGAAKPVATNDSAEGRAENRRIEVVMVK